MPIDVTEPQSDGWHLLRLARKLEGRQKRLDTLDRYLRGDPTLPVGAENAKEAYKAFQRKARLNLAELIVQAPLERQRPTGFTLAGAEESQTDSGAQRMWDANDLDIESVSVHRNRLGLGDAYTIVGPPDEETGEPVITAEDPRQVVTMHDPVRQRRVRSAAKLFHDPDSQTDFAYLYRLGDQNEGRAQVRVATRNVKRSPANPSVRFSPRAWDWDEDRAGELPFNRVPVVRFRNGRGVGEFEPHIDLLDRINHMILQRMVIATFQAFKQRAIKSAPLTDPDTGEEIDYEAIFTADPGAIWMLPGAAEMWESGQVDLTPILTSVRDDLQHAAAVTRTPLTYLTPDAASQSAEGASLMREGLVFKTEGHNAETESGWLDVMSLGFLFKGDTERARRGALRMLWAPVERYSLAERADAASKAGDMPWRDKMIRIWQIPPAEVDRMATQRAEDALLNPRDTA